MNAPSRPRDATPDAAEAARERRLREQRLRERRRAGATGRPDLPAMRTTRAEGGSPARERHEGLFGWVSRVTSAVASAVVDGLRGFAAEVRAVLVGVLGMLLRPLGVGRVLATTAERASRRGDALRHRSIPQQPTLRSTRDLRAAARRRALWRRRLRGLLAILFLASAVLAWRYVPASDAFRIRHVEVTGAGAVGDLEARGQVDPLLHGETVFTVDERALERQLEQLPFVRAARVERHLPNGLELHLSEYRPLALGSGGGRFWLVSRDGRILARASRGEWLGRVPLVTLERERLEPGMRIGSEPALQLLAARRPGSTLLLQSVDVDGVRLTGRLANDVEVRFGRADQLRQKVLVAELMLRRSRRAGVDLAYVDVSVPSRPAICDRATAGCLVPRAWSRDPGGADGEADAATTPEEQGGDEASVLAAADAAAP